MWPPSGDQSGMVAFWITVVTPVPSSALRTVRLVPPDATSCFASGENAKKLAPSPPNGTPPDEVVHFCARVATSSVVSVAGPGMSVPTAIALPSRDSVWQPTHVRPPACAVVRYFSAFCVRRPKS